jgi:hypothetical protein
VEQLKVAPLWGKLLALLSNMKLGWKSLPRTNTSLLQTLVNYGRIKVYTTGTCF